MGHMELSALDDKMKGYIVGIFEGDGYAYHDRKQRHHTVEFYLNSATDMDIAAFLLSLLKKAGLRPSLTKDKRFDCCRLRVRSRELKEFLERDHASHASRDFKLGFVSGMIDAEGYVNLRKGTISVMNSDKNLIDACESFLKDLNINTSVKIRQKSRKDKLTPYRIHISTGFKESAHVSQKMKRGGYILL